MKFLQANFLTFLSLFTLMMGVEAYAKIELRQEFFMGINQTTTCESVYEKLQEFHWPRPYPKNSYYFSIPSKKKPIVLIVFCDESEPKIVRKMTMFGDKYTAKKMKSLGMEDDRLALFGLSASKVFTKTEQVEDVQIGREEGWITAWRPPLFELRWQHPGVDDDDPPDPFSTGSYLKGVIDKMIATFIE